MELRFYNSYSRQIEAFQPIEPGKVRMYHCGPTVYQRPHIGNYRAFLFADLLRRVLEGYGYEVTQVMNLTDVGHLLNDADEGEDKLEAQARKDKVDPWQIVETVSRAFFQDLDALGVIPAHHYPCASDHISEMVAIIEVLIEKGHAYRVGDNVYFDVSTFSRYGQLSGNKVEDLVAGLRLEINEEKRHPADFALWKSDPAHIMKWDTVFGEHGFPGWHIECSAMAEKYLGKHFDIHTGGEDNVFPHHECEIAQSEAANEQAFVNLWMHTRFLQVDGGKMSKSLGNVYSLDDLVARGFSPWDYRFLVLRGHYRTQVNFTWEILRGAKESRAKLIDWRSRLRAAMRSGGGVDTPATIDAVTAAHEVFDAAIADDLNTPEAIAALFTLRNKLVQVGEAGSRTADAAIALLDHADSILGLFEPAAEVNVDSGALSDDQVEALIAERAEVRAAKNWARADEIRDALQTAGIVLEDTASGVHWHRG
ncbi:MAG: cysteine--tRNA ligase [Planctomycetes bacterium]|nr:cysteine--tRNA ligase [Planctomycetota bacterium]